MSEGSLVVEPASDNELELVFKTNVHSEVFDAFLPFLPLMSSVYRPRK